LKGFNLFKTKLGFRIAMVMVVAIVVVEAVFFTFTISNQRQAVLEKRLESLQFSTGILESEIARCIRHSRVEDLNQTLTDLSNGFSAYSYTLFDPKGKTIVQQFLKDGYQNLDEDLKLKLQLVDEEKIPQSQVFKRPEGNILRYIIPFHNDQGDLIAGLDLETPTVAVDAAVKANMLKSASWTLLSALVMGIVVTVLITMVLFAFVVKPVNAMKNEFDALSRGEADLTFQLAVTSKDELGETAKGFNSFLGQIRAMVMRVLVHSEHLSDQVKTMTHSTAEVTAMSEDVTTTVQQIAKGAEEQAAKIAELNHLVQEMHETMKEVEKKAHETSTVVDKATQTARVGGRLAHGTIDKMGELNEIIVRNSRMVEKLGQKSQQVGRAVEIITNIAEQTNLLSLNAAIEAARAGEQGRGFTVVAEEIKLLADGAGKATQEITTLVQEIQEETQAVLESMEKGAKEAQGSKDSIRQMETSLDEIIAVIEGVVQHSKGITELVATQTQRYSKIANSIQDINAVSEESAASTEEVSASTEEQTASMEQVNATCKELAAMAEELRGMVAKFKIQ
jgi:methyl-accepting chemotaxis protein